MTDLYIISACRTPIGSFGGALKDKTAVDLGVIAAEEAIARSGVAPKHVDEVFFGCVLAAGAGQNVARQVGLGAGLPVSVPATTVNMVCGSGMKAIVEAARAIVAGDAEIVLAGGTESMSRAAYVSDATRWGARMGDATLVDSMIRDGLTDAFKDYHMGVTAENVADKWGITREQMDEIALASQEKAATAIASGRFADEIAPVRVLVKRDEVVVDTDEYPRASSSEALAKLRPAFKPDGRVTAGNSSGINDGAAALVVASGDAVARHHLRPMAKLIGWGQSGVDPAIMGVGPIDATEKALARAGLTTADMDLVEANEAFAAQAAAVVNDLHLDGAKVNVNGGAIALGHPIGSSGARIVVTLLHELAKRPNAHHGLATLCVGGGMGVATIYEKCE